MMASLPLPWGTNLARLRHSMEHGNGTGRAQAWHRHGASSGMKVTWLKHYLALALAWHKQGMPQARRGARHRHWHWPGVAQAWRRQKHEVAWLRHGLAQAWHGTGMGWSMALALAWHSNGMAQAAQQWHQYELEPSWHGMAWHGMALARVWPQCGLEWQAWQRHRKR